MIETITRVFSRCASTAENCDHIHKNKMKHFLSNLQLTENNPFSNFEQSISLTRSHCGYIADSNYLFKKTKVLKLFCHFGLSLEKKR